MAMGETERKALKEAQAGDFFGLNRLEICAVKVAVKDGLKPRREDGEPLEQVFYVADYLYTAPLRAARIDENGDERPEGRLYGIRWREGELCDNCEGWGEVECEECGTESSCPDCFGSGALASGPTMIETDLCGYLMREEVEAA